MTIILTSKSNNGQEYLVKKRIGSEKLVCSDKEDKHFIIRNPKIMRLSWILSRKEDINHFVSSWIGETICRFS